ncbi:MAG TPA: c-type cytochrome [Bryobacteraceae bacterium]|jgi:cytochrome c oxidase cbb3-type subunit 3|nr:c-type cytochrome [Bryobacteraceae bacterium]
MPKLILNLLAFALLMHAQDPAHATTETHTQASEEVLAGKSEFGKTCGFCHGATGRGASGPDLIHSTLVSHDVDGNLIGDVVHNGRPDKGMPAFPNETAAQIRAIAAFLHNEAHLAATTYARGPGDYPLSKLLVGNAEQGKRYFAQNCASCHSSTGDLAHVATKYKPIDLQTRIAFPSGLKPTVTVRDASGETFSGTEIYSDEFVVTLRDKDNRLHTFDRKIAHVEIKDPLARHVELLRKYTDSDLHNLFAYLVTLK